MLRVPLSVIVYMVKKLTMIVTTTATITIMILTTTTITTMSMMLLTQPQLNPKAAELGMRWCCLCPVSVNIDTVTKAMIMTMTMMLIMSTEEPEISRAGGEMVLSVPSISKHRHGNKMTIMTTIMMLLTYSQFNPKSAELGMRWSCLCPVSVNIDTVTKAMIITMIMTLITSTEELEVSRAGGEIELSVPSVSKHRHGDEGDDNDDDNDVDSDVNNIHRGTRNQQSWG